MKEEIEIEEIDTLNNEELQRYNDLKKNQNRTEEEAEIFLNLQITYYQELMVKSNLEEAEQDEIKTIYLTLLTQKNELNAKEELSTAEKENLTKLDKLLTIETKSKRMKKELKALRKENQIIIQTNATIIDAIVKDYIEKYPQYDKPEVSIDPKTQAKKTSIKFPSDAEAIDFSLEQANKNRSFILTNQANMVIGYSTGDGKLYHPDGKEFNSGEPFTVSNTSFEDFTIPDEESTIDFHGNSPQ